MIGKISSLSQMDDNNKISLANLVSFNSDFRLFEDDKTRNLGSIYTPSDFAEFLTTWAIRHPEDKILDVGIGEGVFIFAAYRRLLELGASDIGAQQQLFGAEIDPSIYSKFTENAKDINAHFLNLINADFFDVEFPRESYNTNSPIDLPKFYCRMA